VTGFPRASGLRLIRIVLVLVAVGTVANGAVNAYLYLANQQRVDQVCELVINTHKDRVQRYANTITYLGTPGGQERTTLNDYIREKSLPQTRAEVLKERKNLPQTCVAGRELPKIPAAR
jgi:hypothetical protein